MTITFYTYPMKSGQDFCSPQGDCVCVCVCVKERERYWDNCEMCRIWVGKENIRYFVMLVESYQTATPWPGSHQAPLSLSKNTGMGCHFLFQGIFPTQGSNPMSFVSPALAGGFFFNHCAILWHFMIVESIYINCTCSCFEKDLLASFTKFWHIPQILICVGHMNIWVKNSHILKKKKKKSHILKQFANIWSPIPLSNILLPFQGEPWVNMTVLLGIRGRTR